MKISSSRIPREAAVFPRYIGDAPFALWSIVNWILWLLFGYRN